MKKILALVLSALMVLSCAAFAEEEVVGPIIPTEVLTEFGDLTAEDAEYEPNPEYEKWTLVEYYIESADATVIVTCSAKFDESELSLEYSFYGDDQLVIYSPEAGVISDKTGFMGKDTPAMVEFILEEPIWSLIPSVVEFGDLTSDDAEYDPNPDYDKWTVVEYYIESADATVIVTCSAKADNSEFHMEYSFYGDDQLVIYSPEAGVISDKTGFMGNDTPAMVEFIMSEDTVWADLAK